MFSSPPVPTPQVKVFEAHSDYIRSVAVHPTQPFLLTSSDDMLIIRGVNVYPSQIEAELMQVAGLSPHYQLEQGREGNLATLTIRVEALDAGADRAELGARAEERIKTMIGVTASVEVVAPFVVPRSQGKAQRVV